MDKSVPMQDYTVYSNQGTPDVYFDGKFVGKIADGSLTVSMPYKEEGCTVTLENYTVKDRELYVGNAYIPITVTGYECSETDDAGNIVEWWIQVNDVTFEKVVIEVYRRYYYNVTSGKIKKNLTLNYNTSAAKDHNETGYITSTSDTLGGIQVGYLPTANTFAVQLDASNNAYVRIPFAEESSGLMTEEQFNKVDRLRNYITSTTVASLNVNYENIYVTLSANASLSASATGADYNGRTITAYVYTASARTITIPTTGNYVSMCGSSFTTTAGGWVEFNMVCINGIWHIAKLEQE